MLWLLIDFMGREEGNKRGSKETQTHRVASRILEFDSEQTHHRPQARLFFRWHVSIHRWMTACT